MVMKMVNILCFDFVILFVGIHAFLFVYKQNKKMAMALGLTGVDPG